MEPTASSSRQTLLFFTYANQRYEHFAISYILSILSHVALSSVEVVVDDVATFSGRFGSALAALAELFGLKRFRITQVERRFIEARTLPNSIRFLATPSLTAEFVYIGDVDILVLEKDVLAQHLRFMRSTSLPYSNSVRLTDPSRMSGLHFSRFDAYYPVPDVSDLETRRLNDEMLLRILCERKGYPAQDKVWFRPVHGIHTSINRQPLPSVNAKGRAIPGWEFEAYGWAYYRFRRSTKFRAVARFFDEETKAIFRTLDHIFLAIPQDHWRMLAPRERSRLSAFQRAMTQERTPFGPPL